MIDASRPRLALHYRHVNQAEAWQTAEMRPQSEAFVGAIPGDYTRSPYPLQYYFELMLDGRRALWSAI